MSKWEETIKDRLEGYESPLPEGSLAEFQARRTAKKRQPLLWVIVTAAAAGLATLWLLRLRTIQEERLPSLQQPTAAVVEVPLSSQPIRQSALPALTQAAAQAVNPRALPSQELKSEVVKPAEIADEPISDETNQSRPNPENSQQVAKDTSTPEGITIVPLTYDDTPLAASRLKVWPTAGAIAGGGLLAALAGSIHVGQTDAGVEPVQDTLTDPASSDVKQGIPEHRFPLKIGFSVRIPVATRLNLTTGLEYSGYASQFPYYITYFKHPELPSRSYKAVQAQSVHYLGIPVRLDYTMASGKWLDVYLGAGVSGDVCIAAFRAGKPVEKDGFAFSLIGAGGIQANLTKRLGIYAEPELSRSFSIGNNNLETYRTAHPWMFSVATGLRVNLGQ